MSESDILSQSEIDNLLASLSGGPTTPPANEAKPAQEFAPVVTTVEEVPLDDKKGYKLYNFRRPDKFSKDHLRALQDIHREFSRQLSLVLTTYLRMHIEVDVVSVDQLTYDEFTRSMPSPITIGIIELEPLQGQMLMGISHEIVSSVVDRMLGGIGSSEMKPRELTDIEESLAKKIIERISKTLEEAWANIFPAQSKIVGLDNNYSLIQITTPGEIVSLITLEIQISSSQSGLLSLCFPYPLLETILGRLSTQHIFQAKGLTNTEKEQKQILEKINDSKIGIDVSLGTSSISVKDLLELKIGDVLKLNSSIKEDLVISVDNVEKFTGKPGIIKNQVSVKITDTLIN